MIFTSVTFLFYFLPTFLAVYFLMPSTRWKNIILTLASLIFYAWGEPVYVLLMLGSIVLTYFAAIRVDKCEGRRRKIATGLSIAALLGTLIVFKYSDFLVGSASRVIPGVEFPKPGLALPLGISFFIFQSISYVVDVHRKGIKSKSSLLSVVAIFLCFRNLSRDLLCGSLQSAKKCQGEKLRSTK